MPPAPPFRTADSLVGRLADCQSAGVTSRHAPRPQVGNLRHCRLAACTTIHPACAPRRQGVLLRSGIFLKRSRAFARQWAPSTLAAVEAGGVGDGGSDMGSGWVGAEGAGGCIGASVGAVAAQGVDACLGIGAASSGGIACDELRTVVSVDRTGGDSVAERCTGGGTSDSARQPTRIVGIGPTAMVNWRKSRSGR